MSATQLNFEVVPATLLSVASATLLRVPQHFYRRSVAGKNFGGTRVYDQMQQVTLLFLPFNKEEKKRREGEQKRGNRDIGRGIGNCVLKCCFEGFRHHDGEVRW